MTSDENPENGTLSDPAYIVGKDTDTGVGRFHWPALIDALIVIITLVVVKQTFLLYTVKFAGPISTFTAMIVATWRLRARGTTWADLGLKKPENFLKTIGWSIIAFGVIIAGAALGNLLAEPFFDKLPSTNRFGNIEGDIPAFLMWLGLIWTHSAFFEEMLFRAFIIHHLGEFFGGDKAALIISVVLAALFFGYRHAYYQGAFGFVVTGSIGLTLGIFYVWFGRKNLLPQIIAHGTMNTIGFTMRFLGLR